MKTCNALLVGGMVFILSSFSKFKLAAQNAVSSKMEGTWLLDSVQVREVTAINDKYLKIPKFLKGFFINRWLII